MSCNFVDSPCVVPGNTFACKKCTNCNKLISLPAKLAAGNWATLIATTKNQCNAQSTNTPVTTAAVSLPPSAAPQPAVRAQFTAMQPPAPIDPTANLPGAFEPPKPLFAGPGTYLKKYLSKIGITATPTCSCNAKANHMDAMGVKWCEENLDLIVGWLKEEATNRKLPFIDLPARMLVKHAISSAKKAEKAYLKTLHLEENLTV